jgi:AraC family transcriptional regulator
VRQAAFVARLTDRAGFAASGETTDPDPTQPQRARGGLAPWQERRAKAMLAENLSGNVRLASLASACRLSASHFSLAFRQTVGYPPHQWQMRQRVEHAKHLLVSSCQPISDIALAVGFADQSHLTRVFSQLVKTSPAAWRRAQGSGSPDRA